MVRQHIESIELGPSWSGNVVCQHIESIELGVGTEIVLLRLGNIWTLSKMVNNKLIYINFTLGAEIWNASISKVGGERRIYYVHLLERLIECKLNKNLSLKSPFLNM